MRDDTMDVLLRIGMPASAKGLTYICDAIELFDTDPYYPPIFDSWKSKKTATNLVNMGCVAVFYLASMCAIF